MAELVRVGAAWVIARRAAGDLVADPRDHHNTEALGRVSLHEYVYYFQAAGIVLLIP